MGIFFSIKLSFHLFFFHCLYRGSVKLLSCLYYSGLFSPKTEVSSLLAERREGTETRQSQRKSDPSPAALDSLTKSTTGLYRHGEGLVFHVMSNPLTNDEEKERWIHVKLLHVLHRVSLNWCESASIIWNKSWGAEKYTHGKICSQAQINALLVTYCAARRFVSLWERAEHF